MSQLDQTRVNVITHNLDRLFQPGERFEICALPINKRDGVQSGTFDDHDKAAAEALVAESLGYNLYFGINPRNKSVNNELRRGPRDKDEDVERRTHLLIDLDPVRAPGHDKDPATDEERRCAKTVCDAVAKWLCGEHGWPTPYVGDSGNGNHLLYIIDLPANDDGLVERTTKAISAKFSTPQVKIDALFDASRICRLYGSRNCKGTESPERPYRLSKLVAGGGTGMVTLAQLQAVAALAPQQSHQPLNGQAKKKAEDAAPVELGAAYMAQRVNEIRRGLRPEVDAAWVMDLAQNWLERQPPAIEGNKNGKNGSDQTMSVACGLFRQFGVNADEVRVLLDGYNKICIPEWSNKELEHKIEDSLKKVLAEPERIGEQLLAREQSIQQANANAATGKVPSLLTVRGRTEVANAKRLIATHGKDVRWVGAWHKWLVWDGRRWAVDDSDAIQGLAKKVANSLWHEAAALSASEEADAQAVKAMWAFALASNQSHSISAMTRLARDEIAIQPVLLNTHPWLFNVANGTIDLRTGQLRPHAREDYLTQLCPVEYHPDAKCPLWDKFIDEIFHSLASLIVYMKRFFGYCLTGSVREQILAFLYGTGDNGKSTLIEALLALMGTDYATKATQELLTIKSNETQHPTEKADLFGKRFIACVEVEDGRRFAESQIKEMTGGDRIKARRMREDFWEFTPTHKLALAANNKPEIRGRDHGIWRRIKTIPFLVQFSRDPKATERRVDKELPEKLAAESQGILAWLVRGCLDWQKHGLGEPEIVTSTTTEYRNEMDVLGRFITDCCREDPQASVNSSALYEEYKHWCKDAGEGNVVSLSKFGQMLNERGFQVEKTRSCNNRKGIAFNDEALQRRQDRQQRENASRAATLEYRNRQKE